MSKSKNDKNYIYKVIIVLSCIIVGIPLLVFGYTLIDSSIKGSSPVSGERFKNELNPEITDQDLNNLKSNIATLSGVENIDDIVLNSGSLRIYVDATNDQEAIAALAQEVYNTVDSILPISTYFTSSESTKMYDLSIYVYNQLEDSDDWYCYLISKNAASEDIVCQVVSEARDLELAERLRNPDTE